MSSRGALKQKRSFESLLSESINESFTILLDASSLKSFLSYLQMNHKIQEKEIGQNLDIFSSELKKLFGVNASKIEKLVVALLFSKLGLEYEEKDEFRLEDYLRAARAHGVVHNDFNKAPPVLGERDLRLVHALGEDARKSVTQIAKETGFSRPTVTSMIDRLVKQNVLHIKAGLNIRELGFPTACIALECKLMDQRKELVRSLARCPRILMILEPSEKVNMLVFLYGEDQVTLKSTIESFRHFSGVSLVDVFHSGPPQVPASFNLPLFVEKGYTTPCGRACVDCVNYRTNECMGCPAVREYRGPL